MALIYRSIFEVDDPDFVRNARQHAVEWLKWKLEQSDVDLSPGIAVIDEERSAEYRYFEGQDGAMRVTRVSLYENREEEGEQVASTFTALSDGTRSWSWMDIERWAIRQDATPWIAYVPSLVRSILGNAACSRGPTQLQKRHKLLSRQEVPLLVESILEPTREVPVIVVTYHRSEDGTEGAETRAYELMRRVAGIANVYVLGEGSVTPFSQAMLERVGPFMDAHSGVVRVYQPGVGSSRDYSRRHRYVPWNKLANRRPDLVARILAPAVLRRATEIPPPPVWREHLRGLIEQGQETGDYKSLFELASAETDARERELADALAERRELEERLAEAEVSNAELLGAIDDLQRKVMYFQSRLAEAGDADAYVEPPLESFRPQFCVEVVEHARKHLDRVAIHESVDDSAAELDEHATNESWAQKAWTALRALQSYAESKREGFNGDFKTYCSTSAGDLVLPTRWIGMHESGLVATNQRYRDLRTLPIAPEAVPEGRVYMESHIRIELGGKPCPRIHFYDDTSGNTGSIHIGWFGDHLDSFSKS